MTDKNKQSTLLQTVYGKSCTLEQLIEYSPDSIVRTFVNGKQQAGYFQLFWDLKSDSEYPTPDGIYRTFISVATEDTIYHSHGDIQIQR